MSILLIRHAESEFNTKESTSLDSRLTINGCNQAYETAQYIRRHVPDAQKHQIVTSPFTRTRQTAEIIHFHLGLRMPVREDWRLREHIYALSGYVEEQFPLEITGLYNDYILNEVDTEEMILERLKNFWNELDKNGRWIIISHGTPIQTLISFSRGIFSLPKWDKSIKNCNITHFKNGQILLDNYGGHL